MDTREKSVRDRAREAGAVPTAEDARGLDVKTIAKQVEHAADRLERTSEDVRLASAQARRVSQKLS